MAGGFFFNLRDKSDMCHFCLTSEKDYGVQVIILREKNPNDITQKYLHIVKTIIDSKQNTENKNIVFMQVAAPAKAFDHFDNEKYKLILSVEAYFNLLHFFQADWPMVKKRLDSDFQDIKSNRAWISLTPTISFRGPADVNYQTTLDTTNNYSLNLMVTKQYDSGKTNITLGYTDDSLGSTHLPYTAMMALAKDLAYIKSLCEYKEGPPSKKSFQS